MSTKKTIVKSTTAVVLVMLCSRLLGFLRQTIIAGVYGANLSTDIYFISSEFMLNVSGAFTAALTTALVTVYIAVAIQKNKEEAGKVAAKVLTLFLIAAAVILVVLDIFAPQLGYLLAPAYNQDQIALLGHYLRIFSVAFLFSALQSNYAAVLNANNIFVPGKLYGIVFNPIAICFVLIAGEKLGISALVYAYYIANIIQFFILHLRSRGLYSYRPQWNFKDENLIKVGKLALPILIGNIMIQLNGVIDKAICSYLGEGVASAYTYAHTLEQFVTGTFTTTITMILLSRFADYVAKKDNIGMEALLRRSLNAMVLILIPIAMITVLAAGDIVSLIYQRGQFTADSVTVTAAALCGFAIGFPLVAIQETLNRVHYAYQQTMLPMFISIVSVAINAALSILLGHWLGIIGVTAATSLSAIAAVILLVFTAKKHLSSYRFFAAWRTYLKCAAAMAFSTTAVIFIGAYCPDNVLLRTVLKLICGLIVYGAVLALLRCEEMSMMFNAVKTRLRR